jgi:hypothetical protein
MIEVTADAVPVAIAEDIKAMCEAMLLAGERLDRLNEAGKRDILRGNYMMALGILARLPAEGMA